MYEYEGFFIDENDKERNVTLKYIFVRSARTCVAHKIVLCVHIILSVFD